MDMDKKILRYIGFTLIVGSALVMVHTEARADVLCYSVRWDRISGCDSHSSHESWSRVGLRCVADASWCTGDIHLVDESAWSETEHVKHKAEYCGNPRCRWSPE